MKRLFYRIKDKTYLDREAFKDVAQEDYLGIDEVLEIFGIDSSIRGTSLIEV